MTRTVLWISIPFLMLASACSDHTVPTDDNAVAAEGPSVVLITLDTTRADRLGCYGYEAAETEHIDSLARRGVLFEQARTTVPMTLPAHTTLFTGRHPPAHGIRDNGLAALSRDATTLAEAFSEAGYRTGAFVSAFVLDASFGLDQGFDVYDEIPFRSLQVKTSVRERRGDETTDRAIEWVEASGEPFFIWLHLFDPHAPYDPPAPFDARFADSPYDGEIAWVDSQIGRLLETVARRADGGDALVVLTADHGEGLGEHQEETHGYFLYDSTLRVPLVIVGTGLPTGLRIPDPVSFADIAPTILACAGLPPLDNIEGRSLLPLVRGESTETAPIYFEAYAGYLSYGWSPVVGSLVDSHKLIEGSRPRLFDIGKDPREEHDLADEGAGATAEILRAARDRTRNLWTNLSEAEISPDPKELTEVEQLALKQLGYTLGRQAEGPLPYATSDLADPHDKVSSIVTYSKANSILAHSQETGDTRVLLAAVNQILIPALQEDPDNSELLSLTGTFLCLCKRFKAAVPYLRKAVEIRPDRLESRYNLGLSLSQLGQRDGAFEALETCLRIRPRFVKAARTLAEWEEWFDNPEKALSYWEHFLEHWGADDDLAREARENVARLKKKLAER